MTIIQPPKKNIKNFFSIILMGIFLFCFSLLGIFFYNSLVEIKHDIKKKKVEIREEEIKNIELKNQLLLKLNITQVHEFEQKNLFIIEKNPEYIKLGKTALSVN